MQGFAVSMVPEAGRAFATVAAVLSAAAKTSFSVSPGLSALTQRAVETSVVVSASASGSTATDTVFSMGGLLQALDDGDGDGEPLTPRLVDLSADESDPLIGAARTRMYMSTVGLGA
jgi:hypothetical protein